MPEDGKISVTTEVTGDTNFKLYEDLDIVNKYNPFRIHDDNHDHFVKGIPIIFFSTPKINFSEFNISKNTFFSYMYYEEAEIMKSLSYGVSDSDKIASHSPFIKLLTNTAGSFNTKDTTARTKEVGETFYGFKQTLPAASVDSITGDEFSIKYHDYKDLPVLKMHKLWFEYAEAVRRGVMAPSKDAINKRYIDYVSSVYYFILDMDFETILFYSKYTGVAPTNLPYSVFSMEMGQRDVLEYDINYVYSYKEDLNPAILVDFNKIVTSGQSLYHNFTANTDSYLPTTKKGQFSADELYTKLNKSTVQVEKYVDSYNKTKFKLVFDGNKIQPKTSPNSTPNTTKK